MVIGLAVGDLIDRALLIGVEAAVPHKAAAELCSGREASVFIKNGRLARKFVTHFWKSVRPPSAQQPRR